MKNKNKFRVGYFVPILLFLLAISSFAYAQKKVSGKISDGENGSALPGVTVLVKGTQTGTVSDSDGNYSISVPAGSSDILVFSFVGYISQEVAVGAQTTLNVSMATDVRALEEIVVTGYSSQQKKDISGSVAVVKAKDLTAVPAGTTEQMLQGRAAGVTVISSGQPGSGSSVRIRGFSSFGNNQPLYVVDGVQTFDISTINPNDIESMQVLKDAGAASIYGARASNGVIIVSTKRGKSGAAKITYDGYYGVQAQGKGFTNLLNTQEMADLTWLALKNSGQALTSGQYGSGSTPVIPDYIVAGTKSGVREGDPATNPALYNIDYGAGDIYQIVRANKQGTNWYKEVTRSAPIQSHNLGLSGGNDNANYYVGLNYFDQQGLVLNTYLKRYTLRANTDFKIKKNIRAGQSTLLSYRDNPTIGNLSEGNEISNSYRIQPIVPVYDINGGFAGTRGVNLGNGSNPVASRIRAADNKFYDVKLVSNAYAEVDVMKDFTFKSSFGVSLQNGYGYAYSYRTYENAENGSSNSFSENAYFNNTWNWSNTLTYKKTVGKHNVTALVGTEAYKEVGRGMGGSRINYYSDDPNYRTLSSGAAGINNNSYAYKNTLYSLFGRVDYSFDDKYILSATVRRDGSSRFGQNNTYGVFPSVTAAWRISQEEFMKSITWISDLKLRGGYGTMGSQLNINAINKFSLFGGGPGDAYYAIQGQVSQANQGFRQVKIGNPDAKWETNTTANVGFDASLFDGSWEITVDWYQKKTTDLLRDNPLPALAGAATPPTVNVASMQNTGLDLSITKRGKIASDWKYDATLTLTTYKNKITFLQEGTDYFTSGGSRFGDLARNQVGNPLSSFFGYKVVGLFQSAEDVSKSPTQDSAAPGRFKYQDTDGDGRITDNDRTFIGNPNPKFTYGFNLNVSYKNFDLSMFWYGVQGKEVYNYTKWWTDFYPSFQGAKSTNALYNSWSPTNTGASTPIAENNANFSTNQVSNSYYIENGSYLRLKNIQLGYNLPSDLLKKYGIDRLRAYIQGANLFTLTKYTGLDPELAGDDTNYSIDYGNYPNVKQYIIGVNLTF
ncbi:MAG: TonB-dependent receptor [Cytophagales bacterium]|nr:MAG: TonB-dependent receptor [Cytophagales bacterium]